MEYRKTGLYSLLEGFVGAMPENESNELLDLMISDLTESKRYSWAGLYHLVDNRGTDILEMNLKYNNDSQVSLEKYNGFRKKMSRWSEQVGHLFLVNINYIAQDEVDASQFVNAQMRARTLDGAIRNFRTLWEGDLI